jgi:hypothetical protein
MPDATHIIGPADLLRETGVVYFDPDLAQGPATHVLIVGVAAYTAEKYKTLLDTATVSARTMADWFLGTEAGQFNNPNCDLGSLAILLSERPGTDKAIYAGGSVPRANFCATKNAVREWLARINTNKDNLAFIYVASHGESFTRRTAFLLDDYGSDPDDVTSGMVEVEQFIASLENAQPVSQLLIFDCCRSPISDALPWDEQVGNKLISLKRKDGDHGLPRKQWVICSTTLGEVAIGLTGKPTLFNSALMEGLNGVASDTSADQWPVRPGLLIDKLDKILGLHRLPDEDKPQTPAGKMAGSFDITFPGEPADVPVYITTGDPKDWPGTTLTLSRAGADDVVVEGAEAQSPFFMRRVPELQQITVVAKNEDEPLGSVTAKVRAPAAFVEVRRTPVPPPLVTGQLAARRSLRPMAKITVRAKGPPMAANAILVEVTRRDQPTKNPKQAVMDMGVPKDFEVVPGEHVVTLRMPDGSIQTREVSVARDAIIEVSFEVMDSPREWLRTATLSGLLKSLPLEEVINPPALSLPETPPMNNGSDLYGRLDGIVKQTDGATDLFREEFERAAARYLSGTFLNVGPIGIAELTPVDWPDEGIQIVRRPSSSTDAIAQRIVRFDIKDRADFRFWLGSGQRPHFAEIIGVNRREFAVLPTIGSAGSDMFTWNPHLIVNSAAPARNKLMTTVLVEDHTWSGLLAFLAARDMSVGAKLLDSGMGEAAVSALYDKVSNPIAAAAGALIAVSVALPNMDKRWDPWLYNFANLFPGIPDGAIILARRLMNRARSAGELKEAREWFAEGFWRGVPYFSLSVDWLARGLESLPGDDAELETMARAARRLANRVDSTGAFTVIRMNS